MPRYNVQRPDGQWACFSSIVDGFITEFMPIDEYQLWRLKEYGVDCGDIKFSNRMDYHEAVGKELCRVACNKGYDLADLPEFSCPCDYCKFWNKDTDKCEIVERQSEVETDGVYH